MNANPFVINAIAVTDRKPTIRTAQPAPHTPNRWASVAQQLTLSGYALTRAELLSEALHAAAALCFELDTDGSLANLDRDGRCLRPMPWGKKGGQMWGLRRTETDVLRAILRDWAQPKRGEPLPLWVWDGEVRSWFVNLGDYGSFEAAKAFLSHRSVTSHLYKKYAQRIRTLRTK